MHAGNTCCGTDFNFLAFKVESRSCFHVPVNKQDMLAICIIGNTSGRVIGNINLRNDARDRIGVLVIKGSNQKARMQIFRLGVCSPGILCVASESNAIIRAARLALQRHSQPNPVRCPVGPGRPTGPTAPWPRSDLPSHHCRQHWSPSLPPALESQMPPSPPQENRVARRRGYRRG